jgi:hypothetical protein
MGRPVAPTLLSVTLFLLPLPLLLGVVPSASCGSHTGAGPQADEYVLSCQDTPGGEAQPVATDESFAAFLKKEAAMLVIKDDGKCARLASPASGAEVSEAGPPTFTLALPAAAERAGARRHLASCPVRSRPGFWRRLGEAVVLERTAHAHCPPFTGENYLLRLTGAGESAAAYTALLSIPSFTPNATIWRQAMKGRVGQTLTVTLERAVFLKGEMVEGPFAPSEPMVLTVVP